MRFQEEKVNHFIKINRPKRLVSRNAFVKTNGVSSPNLKIVNKILFNSVLSPINDKKRL